MSNAAIEAINFAIKTDDPKGFLQTWREGDWATIQKEWPEAPVGVFPLPEAPKEKAPVREPVAWYNGEWTLSNRAYQAARKGDPTLFLNMRPAFPG